MSKIKMGERNEVLSNVSHISKERTKEILKFLKDVLIETYGPFGSTVLIGEEATKDGISVLNAIEMDDVDDKLVYAYVREVCRRALFTGGDNTTTAVILSSTMYDNIYLLWKQLKSQSQITSREFSNNIKNAVDFITEKLHSRAKKELNEEDMINVVKTSLNHDERNLKVFQDIFKEAKEKNININELKIYARVGYDKKETTYQLSKGYTVDKPIELISNIDSEVVTLEDVRVIPYSTGIHSPEDFDYFMSVMQVVAETNEKTLFIATDIKPSYMDLIKSEMSKYYSNTGRIIPLYFLFTEDFDKSMMDKWTFSDLYCVLNTTPIMFSHRDTTQVMTSDKFLNYPVVSLSCHKNKTEFYNLPDKNNIKLNTRLRELMTMMSTLPDGDEKNIAQLRYNKIMNSVVIIFVACETEKETKRVYDAFEDATIVLRNAMKYGVVEGGNTAIPKTIFKYSKVIPDTLDKYISAIENSYLDAWDILLISAGINKDQRDEIRKNTFADLNNLSIYNILNKEFTKDILHSVELESKVLKAASEIVSILVTSNLMLFPDAYSKSQYVNRVKNKEEV